jgi:lon-related putative ATP-dependent protease
MDEQTQELESDQILFSVPPETVSRLRQRGATSPIIGQDRAISALELGLGIKANGYNIFIMGASGTGRRTVLTSLLANYRANQIDLQDIAYVHNFARPLEPKALFFPAGTGGAFRSQLKAAIESIRKQGLQLMKSETFLTAQKKVTAESDAGENQLLAEFEAKMASEGFKLLQVKDDDDRSMDLVPVINGKTRTFDELQERVGKGRLAAEALGAVREAYYRNLDRMSLLFADLRDRRRATDKKIRALKIDTAKPIIDAELSALRALCADGGNELALAHLDALREDLLARIHSWTEPFKSPAHRKIFYGRYDVNLVCEETADKSFVVQEEVPTFAKLFGSIEAPVGNEDPAVNGHLRLRPGAVHRAAGGFLVLRLQDLLLEEGAWPYLKRVLQTGKIEIQSPPSGMHAPSLIKAQSVPARLKVIIIGGEHSYDFLYQEDPDFQKLFKVCAEFDSIMPGTDDNMARFIAFVDEYAKGRSLLPIDDDGMARILSYAARMSEYRNMLTTRFTQITDLINEADFAGRKAGAPSITSDVVAAAIDRRRFLQKLPEEKYADMIHEKEILLDVSGKSVGKVNGLAVHDRGYLAFGIPVVVTAQAAPGDKGVINIERESGLSGEIYDKAHLIIQGLLHRKYAREIPLALSASICFEQSYTEVDGDSASCASFYALLSAIAQIPLRQDIAITGSLNQLGDVQPVGGVPEKIEGFFDTCRILGLTGTQGVIIPRRNLNNLLPADRVQKAIREGSFHVWAIDSVDQGLEILSGVDSAAFGEKICATLADYASRMQNFGK